MVLERVQSTTNVRMVLKWVCGFRKCGFYSCLLLPLLDDHCCNQNGGVEQHCNCKGSYNDASKDSSIIACMVQCSYIRVIYVSLTITS